jgi:broad specificity phosphatase PhoE
MLLVRHGQSTWNAAGRWQGRADPPLTALGEQQARQAAGALGSFDVVVSSPLQRAWRTAELIGDELGIGPVQPHDDLAEREVGPWTGLTFEEIDLTWPGALQRREWPAGFEDDEAIVERAVRAVVELAAYHPGASVLGVTHGGVLHALERGFGRTQGRFTNLSGFWLAVDDGRITFGERVLLAEVETGGRSLSGLARTPSPVGDRERMTEQA